MQRVSNGFGTHCFNLTGNKMFLTEKRSVSHSETKCFFKMRKYSANLLKFK